jgi:hypothetical protein
MAQDAAAVLALIKGASHDERLRVGARKLLLAGGEKGESWQAEIEKVVNRGEDRYADELERLAWIGLQIRDIFLNTRLATDEAGSVAAEFIQYAVELAAQLNATEEGRLVCIGWHVSRLEYWTAADGAKEN